MQDNRQDTWANNSLQPKDELLKSSGMYFATKEMKDTRDNLVGTLQAQINDKLQISFDASYVTWERNKNELKNYYSYGSTGYAEGAAGGVGT